MEFRKFKRSCGDRFCDITPQKTYGRNNILRVNPTEKLDFAPGMSFIHNDTLFIPGNRKLLVPNKRASLRAQRDHGHRRGSRAVYR